jgi:hypothetical protein
MSSFDYIKSVEVVERNSVKLGSEERGSDYYGVCAAILFEVSRRAEN